MTWGVYPEAADIVDDLAFTQATYDEATVEENVA
jgi:hypothetical protein